MAKIFAGKNAEVPHIDIYEVEKDIHAEDDVTVVHEEKGGLQTQHTVV